MAKAIFAGSFDPLHEGHINVIEKALKLFDKLYVVVANNPEKSEQTSLEKRYLEATKKLAGFENVIVEKIDKQLIAEYAKEKQVKFLIRSARDQNDYAYELEMAAANHFLNNELETILIIPSYDKLKYKSRLLKQGIK